MFMFRLPCVLIQLFVSFTLMQITSVIKIRPVTRTAVENAAEQEPTSPVGSWKN